MRFFLFLLIFCPFTFLGHTAAQPNTPGITKQEIVIGSILDLSGPAALLGIPTRDGMLMRIEEANATGGIHGRTLRLIIEDSAYDPKRGALAARKLIQHNNVFAFLANLGTPVVMASMPAIIAADRLHLFPFSPHSTTYLPTHPLKFQIFPPYQDYMAAATAYMAKTKGYLHTCLLYQDDDYGLEVKRGVESGLLNLNQTLTAETRYKRGATDFSSQITRLRQAQCDLIVLATLVRETVAVMNEAQRQGWKVDMLVTASGYSEQTHELGGAAVEGLYGVSVLPHPYRANANPAQLDWINRYHQRFGVEPNVWSVMGYILADLFIQAAEKAGPDISTASFSVALEQLQTHPHFLGSPVYQFSTTSHLGSRQGRLAQIQNGRWKWITDYLQSP